MMTGDNDDARNRDEDDSHMLLVISSPAGLSQASLLWARTGHRYIDSETSTQIR